MPFITQHIDRLLDLGDLPWIQGGDAPAFTEDDALEPMMILKQIRRRRRARPGLPCSSTSPHLVACGFATEFSPVFGEPLVLGREPSTLHEHLGGLGLDRHVRDHRLYELEARDRVPNCSRSLAYLTDSSTQPWQIPTQPAATVAPGVERGHRHLEPSPISPSICRLRPRRLPGRSPRCRRRAAPSCARSCSA